MQAYTNINIQIIYNEKYITYVIDYHDYYHMITMITTTWLPWLLPHDYLISLLFPVNFEMHCVVVVQY